MDDMTILVRAGMVFAAAGLFIASYYRFSNPVRLNVSKDRRAPQLSAEAPNAAAESPDSRRAPSL